VADGVWPRHLSGSTDHLCTVLEQLATDAGADELMIQDLIADQAARVRSYQLIADTFAQLSALCQPA
jgi:hypothetical protein